MSAITELEHEYGVQTIQYESDGIVSNEWSKTSHIRGTINLPNLGIRGTINPANFGIRGDESQEWCEPSIYLRRYKRIEVLEKIYTFDNPEEIYSFLLMANEHVIEVLEDAPIYIAKFFEDAPLDLVVHHDPEEGFELLFIKIKTDLPGGRAVDLLDELDDKWWPKIDKSVRKILAVDV